MTETNQTSEVQRGKRRTARYTEITLVAMMIASIWGLPNAFEIFKLILIPALAYAASLRGLDAHYK